MTGLALPKSPRQHATPYLKMVASLPCLLSGRIIGVQAAHIAYGSVTWDKHYTGMAEKADDRWTVPLCQELHLMNTGSQHHHGHEELWWAQFGVDPLRVAHLLWEYRDRFDLMLDVVEAFTPKDRMVVARIAGILMNETIGTLRELSNQRA